MNVTDNFLRHYELARRLNAHTYSNDSLIFFHQYFTTTSSCL